MVVIFAYKDKLKIKGKQTKDNNGISLGRWGFGFLSSSVLITIYRLERANISTIEVNLRGQVASGKD